MCIFYGMRHTECELKQSGVLVYGSLCYWIQCEFNTLRPRQNGRCFADDTFKRIFLNENVRISIKISLKFVPMGPINNNPALVQIMAWRRPGDKPLSEPMMVSLLTYICITRPQWVSNLCGTFCHHLHFTSWDQQAVLSPWDWPEMCRDRVWMFLYGKPGVDLPAHLTLDILEFFKEPSVWFDILCEWLKLTHRIWLKLTIINNKNMLDISSQYRICCSHGDVRSQGITSWWYWPRSPGKLW